MIVKKVQNGFWTRILYGGDIVTFESQEYLVFPLRIKITEDNGEIFFKKVEYTVNKGERCKITVPVSWDCQVGDNISLLKILKFVGYFSKIFEWTNIDI